MIDLRTSRREYFLRCAYWSQMEEEFIKDDKIVYYKEPDGFFMAKEISSYNISSNIVAGVFMFQNIRLTIETKDDIGKLERNDIVEIDSRFYRVEDIQVNPQKKQRQFLRNNYSNSYTITLVG